MFELETMVKAKLTEIGVLSQKNRDTDEKPGVALSFELIASNDILTMFSPTLRSFVYYKSAAASDGDQGRIDVETNDLPNLTEAGQSIPRLKWKKLLSGYTLTIDHGLGGRNSDIELQDCLVQDFAFMFKEGGTVEMHFLVEAKDVLEKVFAKLPAMKNREIQISLVGPGVDAQQDLAE